eukprot:gene5103-7113_t
MFEWLYLFSLFFSLTVIDCARFNTIGGRDVDQSIRLKSQYDLQPATVLKLPINVPQEYITLFGTLPPRLTKISSINPNSVYGVGDVIYIDLQFTAEVLVSGTPTITLNTGCHDISCTIKEIKSFTCASDRGMFAIRLGGDSSTDSSSQFIMNIAANTTTSTQFKQKIEELKGINTVSVKYGNSDDRIYSGGDRVCTSIGKNITIIFDNVTFSNGNVPDMYFSTTNDFPNPRSGLDLGDGSILFGVHTSDYTPKIVANTLVEGFAKDDGIAYYDSGSQSNTIRFAFIVEPGDYVSTLEVKSINFDNGYIFSNITGANISTILPSPNAGPRYMTKSASALGFNKNISITSAAPRIISVTSSALDGTYTEGDELDVIIVYDLPVKFEGESGFTLQLSTGSFDRFIPFTHIVDNVNMYFHYVVQKGDSSNSLDVLSSSSFYLNGGAIYRKTSTNQTTANTTLPFPGSKNSLSVTKSIIINTQSPQVVNVYPISAEKVYTAGDSIDFKIQYENKIFGTGDIRLLVRNTPRNLDVQIRSAPYNPLFSYSRAFPGHVMQSQLQFSINTDLVSGDVIMVYMPGFHVSDPIDDTNRSLSISGDYYNKLSALWNDKSQILFLTINSSIPQKNLIDILIDGRSGLIVPNNGVISAKDSIRFEVLAASINSSFSRSPIFDIETVSPVGFRNLSLEISPLYPSAQASIILRFDVPELLTENDEILLKLYGFSFIRNGSINYFNGTSGKYSIISNTSITTSTFNMTWNPYKFEFKLVAVSDQQKTSHEINITKYIKLFIPEDGVGSSTISLSTTMKNNGNMSNIRIPFLTTICGVQPSETFVDFLTKSPGLPSDIQLSLKLGPNGLQPNDAIIITLPNSNLTQFTTLSNLVAAYGRDKGLFNVFIQDANIKLLVQFPVPGFSSISLVVDASSYIRTPLSGINSDSSYSVYIMSSQCVMNSPQLLNFDKANFIMAVFNPSLIFYPQDFIFDEKVSLKISFGLFNNLAAGDMFSVTIPGLNRDVLVDPYNNSIITNANVSLRFNRRVDRLEFTFQSNFNYLVTPFVIVNVTRAEGFYLPSIGFSSDNIKLNIRSGDYGILTNQEFDEEYCFGVCSSTVHYSSVYLEDPISITFSLTYSQSITAGMVFNFSMKSFSNQFVSSSISSTVSLSNGTVYTAQTIWNEEHHSLAVELPISISSKNMFQITINNLQYDNNTDFQNPFAPILKINDSTFDTTIIRQFAPPIILRPLYIYNASITFSSSKYNSTLIDSTPRIDTAIDGVMVSIIKNSSWSELENLLIITFDDLFQAPSNVSSISFQIYDFKLPQYGISSNVSLSKPKYALGSTHLADKFFEQTYLTSFRNFDVVEEIAVIFNFSASIVFNTSVSLEVSTISLSFETSALIRSSDFIRVYLPYLESAGSGIQLIYSCSLYNTTANWADSSYIEIKSSIDFQYGSPIIIQIDTVRSGLAMRKSGIPLKDAKVELYIVDSLSNIIASDEALVPCVGICSATISSKVSKAGYPTSFTINTNFGSLTPFHHGDQLSFYLIGFSSLNSSSSLLNKVFNVTGHDDELFEIILQLTWDNQNSVLSLASFPITIPLNESNQPSNRSFYSLSFDIPQDYGIITPAIGVRQSSYFNISWNQQSNSIDFASNSLKILPIGKAITNSLSINPTLPSSPIALSFFLSFYDDMIAGDRIFVYMPSFIIPPGPVYLFDAELSQKLSVSGEAYSTTTLSNADESTYMIPHTAHLIITLLEDLSALNNLSVTIPLSAGIISPTVGIYRNTIPKFAVISKSNPIATTIFANISAFSSLSPSTLNIIPKLEVSCSNGSQQNSTNCMKTKFFSNAIELSLQFTINCGLFAKDSIEVSLPNVANMDYNYSVRVNHSNPSLSVYTTWNNQSNIVRIELYNNSYILSKILKISLSLVNFKLTDDLLYENDKGYSYNIISDSCGVQNALIDNSGSLYLKSSSLSFPGITNNDQTVLISAISSMKLLAGDKFEIILHGVQIEQFFNTTNSTFLISGSSGLSQNASITHLNQSNIGILLVVDVLSDILPGETIRIETKQINYQLIHSVNGTLVDLSRIRLLRFNDTLFESNTNKWNTIFSGPFDVIEPIYSFLKSSIKVFNLNAGKLTSLSIQWKFSSSLVEGDQIVVYLPNFIRIEPKSNSVLLRSIASTYFSCEWSYEKNYLIFTALSYVAPQLEVEAVISIDQSFQSPIRGIPSNSHQFYISLIKLSNPPLLVHNSSIEDVNAIPYVESSSISFISSDIEYAYSFGGNYNILQLYPGHELNQLDTGFEVVVDGKVYTIQNVANDLLYLIEPYVGRRIFLGDPIVTVSTPPYRYARFIGGSTTTLLQFQYTIGRGDKSSNLTLFSPLIRIVNGVLLRNSLTPAIEASLSLPTVNFFGNWSINTDSPKIVRVYTTTISGVYSEGQKVDIQVEFDENVVIGGSNYSTPILLLKVHPFGKVVARYSSGSGSKVIVFVYSVQINDFQIYTSIMNYNLINSSSPIFQPLRIITNQHFNYLRRSSVFPIIDAEVDISSDVPIDIPNNISIVGEANRVSSVWISGVDGKSYTAGDLLNIYITFTSSIELLNLAASNNTLLPYILIDVGNTKPAKAVYSSMYNSSTMQFSYTITINDKLTNGLYLHCTCVDYFNRTWIRLDDSTMINSTFHGLSPSIILAENSSNEELLVDAFVRIENNVPRVVSISSNLSLSGEVRSPGDIAVIRIQFSYPVTIYGILSLRLKGANQQSCPARLLSGNNTDQLNFVYILTTQSSTSRVDCTRIDSLDLSFGSIYRKSLHPIIAAVTTLPRPGSQGSLGFNYDTVVDVSKSEIKTLNIVRNDSTTDAISTAQTIAFNRFLQEGSHSIFAYSLRDSVEFNSLTIINTLQESEVLYDGLFPYDIIISNNDYDNSIDGNRSYIRQSISSQTNSYFPFNSISRSILQSSNSPYWWNSYDIRSFVDFEVAFGKPITHRDAFISLSSSNNKINRAFSSNSAYWYFLRIRLDESAGFSSLNQYKIEYNGLLSRCISVTASAQSASNSIQSSLENISEVKSFIPAVLYIDTTDNIALYSISFTYLPKYPLNTLTGPQLGGSCPSPSPLQQVSINQDYTKVIFEYEISSKNGIALQTNDIIPANKTISMNIPISNYGMSFNPLGLSSNSIVIDQYNSNREKISTQYAFHENIPYIYRSAISFSENIPNRRSIISVKVCLSVYLMKGDNITLYLPGFNASNELSHIAFSTNTSDIEWDGSSSSISLTLNTEIEKRQCFEELIMNSTTGEGLLYLPLTSLAKNSAEIRFSAYLPLSAPITNQPFQSVSPVGISKLHINFGPNPIPGSNCEVNVAFEILPSGIYTNSSVLEIILPKFSRYFYSLQNNDLELIGVYSRYFVVHWVNESSSLIVKPKEAIQSGKYEFTITNSEWNSIIMPSEGVSRNENPPSFSFNNTEWSSTVQEVYSYPEIYGSKGIKVYIETSTISDSEMQYVVDAIHLTINTTRSIVGPAKIQLTLPFLNNSIGYYQSSYHGNTSNENSDEIISINWDDSLHSFIISNAKGWEYNELPLTISLVNLTNFFVTDVGVQPYPYNGMSVIMDGIDGFTGMIPVTASNIIPVIQSSSLKISNFTNDLFSSYPVTIDLTLLLNIPIEVGDIFTLTLAGQYSFNHSETSLDSCAFIQDSFYSSTATIIRFVISNESDCAIRYKKNIHWSITENIAPNSTTAYNISKAIAQYDTHSYTIAWKNKYFDVYPIDVQNVPTIGLSYSSITIQHPYLNSLSPLLVHFMTSCDIAKGDEIIFQMDGFVCEFDSTIVNDSYYRQWEINKEYNTSLFRMKSTQHLSPTAVSISLKDGNKCRIPNYGISNNMIPDNYTVTITRNEISLIPQKIHRISNIGEINDLIYAPSYNEEIGLEFSLDFATYVPLEVNDIIILHDPSLNITRDHYLSFVNADGTIDSSFQVLAISSNSSFVITVKSNRIDRAISLRTKKSKLIRLIGTVCKSSKCPLFVEIISHVSPAKLSSYSQATLITLSSIGFKVSQSSPTMFPTFQPTVNVTIIKPTVSPSAKPTASPTQTFSESYNHLTIDIAITTQSVLLEKGILVIHLPSVIIKDVANSTDFANNSFTIKLQSSADETMWDIALSPANNTLLITALSDIPAGEILISVYSLSAYDGFHFVYSNQQIAYELHYGSYVPFSGVFDSINSLGLKSSSLTFSNPIAEQMSGLSLSLQREPGQLFLKGENVTIDLQGFSLANSSSSLNITDSQFAAVWYVLAQELVVLIHAPTAIIDINIPSSVDIYYFPSPFSNLMEIAPTVSMQIHFISPIAGQTASINIAFSGIVSLDAYDTIDIFLPQFWAVEEALKVVVDKTTVNDAVFESKWLPCDEKLRIMTLSIFNTTSFNLTIDGLSLPLHGITSQYNYIISVSSNSSTLGVLKPVLLDIDLLSVIESSSLLFFPHKVDQTISLSSSFILNIDFTFNDTLILSLPGVDLSSSFPHIGLKGFNQSVLFGEWDQSTHKLMINAKYPHILYALNEHVIMCNDSVTLTNYGYPQADNIPSIMLITGNSKVIGGTGNVLVDTIDQVGFINSQIYYIIDEASLPIKLRFKLFLSDSIIVGDVIYIQAPFVINEGPANIENYGDLADVDYLSLFDIKFESDTKTFVLTARQSFPAREFNVFTASNNSLYLSRNSFQYTNSSHSLSANISSIGVLTSRPIPFSPSHLPSLHQPKVTFPSCHYSSQYIEVCNMDFQFELTSDLHEGDIIVISHENFDLSDKEQNTNISIISNSYNNFTASLHHKDEIAQLVLQPNISILSNGYLKSYTDIVTDNVNTVIPSQLQSIPNATIVTTIPRIINIFSDYLYSNMPCGDVLRIYIQFDRNITITEPINLSLLLSNKQLAIYNSKWSSDTLLFIYRHFKATIDSDLSILGPGALEYSSSSMVVDDIMQSNGANLTVPSFFYEHPIILSELSGSVLLLSCDASIPVTSVESYSESNKIYATGDVLDISIVFERAVSVVGQPSIILTNIDDNLVANHSVNASFTANFMNVSSIQYVELDNDGYYTLSYNNSVSSCILWNDKNGLFDALKSFSDLQLSLPVQIESLATDKTIKYRLLFKGVPPLIFQTTSLMCDHETSPFITVDETMWNRAIFRYVIKEGDEAELLTLSPNNLLMDSMNYITFHNNHLRFNVTLPSMLNQNSLVSSKISIDTNIPTIASVYSLTSHPINLTSGDSIFIVVNYSRPISIIGSYPTNNIFLELNFTSFLSDNLTNNYYPASPPYYRNISFHSLVDDNLLYFNYKVFVGDYALLLSTSPSNTLYLLNGVSIKLKSVNPSTYASLVTPAGGAMNGLMSSEVQIKGDTFPIIEMVYTNASSTSVASIGSKIFVFIKYSSPVMVQFDKNNNSKSATDDLYIPLINIFPYSNMTYLAGNNSITLIFQYIVPMHSAIGEYSSIEWYMTLFGGYFNDRLGNVFYNSSSIRYAVNITISTAPASVVRVDTTSEDGIYFNGETLDFYVVFTKPVSIIQIGNEKTLPKLELFVPYQVPSKMLAEYSYGNNTNELHFSYTIPPADANFPPQFPYVVDYASTTALYEHMGSYEVRDYADYLLTNSDIFLPTSDRSYLIFNRTLFFDYSACVVKRVYSKSSDGVYTLGDVIYIAVEFTRPVMVFYPPVLKLYTSIASSINRSAYYFEGNMTNELIFSYEVQLGDSAKLLDYIDTRYSPYFTQVNQESDSFTFALNIDVELSAAQVFDVSTTIVSYPTKTGGVFVLSSSSYIPVVTALPLPSKPRSLSYNSKIEIDASQPFIKLVTTRLSSGTYGAGVIIPIEVIFNVPIVVKGCPKVLFQISDVDKYAEFISQSDNKTLLFHYTVDAYEYVDQFDYKDTHSLKLEACSNDPLGDYYIKRKSDNPSIDANLTMPWVKYKETVIAPVSISGGGNYIILAGGGAYARLVWTSSVFGQSHSFGDIIEIYIGYSRSVSYNINDANSYAYLDLTDAMDNIEGTNSSNGNSVTHRPVYYTRMINETTVLFLLTVQSYDPTVDSLTYFNYSSLLTSSSCVILDTEINFCANQNVPNPFATINNRKDSLSGKKLSIKSISDKNQVIDIYILSSNESHVTGSYVAIAVHFKNNISVSGTPLLFLSLHSSDSSPSSLAVLSYRYLLDFKTAVFVIDINNKDIFGTLSLTQYSILDLNGGSIFNTATFLPILTPDLSLKGFSLSLEIIQLNPVVVSVTSPQQGVFSTSDQLNVLITFSHPVTVVGMPVLLLDLPYPRHASYESMVDNYTLLFTYNVQSTDYTSSLDYISTDSLVAFYDNNLIKDSLYDGIYLQSQLKNTNISVDINLPQPGTENSLGRSTSIFINVDRPSLLSIIASPLQATSGDDLEIIITYSQPMVALTSNGINLLNNNIDSSTYYIGISLLFKSSSSNIPNQRVIAYLKSIKDKVVTFTYSVTNLNPTGNIFLQSTSPFIFSNAVLQSSTTLTSTPSKTSVAVAQSKLGSIDNSQPVVTRVYSPIASSTYPYGIGDIIDIYVEFSLNVIVYGSPTLRLVLSNRSPAYAYYVNNSNANSSASHSKTIHFQYAVLNGDTADSLVYDGIDALQGRILRYSTRNPSIVANLLLPAITSPGSLGGCCKVVIDSNPPYVASILPLKRVGIYGENEEIVIMVRFDKPVIVTGNPILILSTGKLTTYGIATYISNFTASDLMIPILETDVLFSYIVQRYDNILSLIHYNSTALILSYNHLSYQNYHNYSIDATIYHKTNNPSIQVDISLRDPSDFTKINGKVTKQWMYRYPSSIELVFRDLYHTQSDTLSASIDHGNQKANVFSSCCMRSTFGRIYPKTKLNNNSTKYGVDTGIGYDYMFSDIQSENIALKGKTSQSSTSVSSYRAIDGNIDPLIGDLSVSATTDETNAWWLLQLPTGSKVASMILYARQPQIWIDPIVSFTVRALEGYPIGYFKLGFSNLDSSSTSGASGSSGSDEILTSKLIMGITAEDLSIQIESLSGLGNVEVTRSLLPLCTSEGCGVGFEHGYGFTYTIIFKSLQVTSPTVAIRDILFIGQDQSSAEINLEKLLYNYSLPLNVRLFQLVTHVDVVRLGYYLQVPIVAEYGKGVDTSNYSSININKPGDNEWLTPFWIFIFNISSIDTIPTDLNESIHVSVWSQRVESIDKSLSIVLTNSLPLDSTHIKIQREGYGSLSIAEFEVYSNRLKLLSEGVYEGGSPIRPSWLLSPYQPNTPFKNSFQYDRFDHDRWMIQVRQDYKTLEQNIQDGNEGAFGTISEVVLIITDMIGVTHSFYQDIKAEVTSLPKYGNLTYTSSFTPSPYGDWRELFELGEDGLLVAKTGFERYLGLCYGANNINNNNNNNECGSSYGVGPLMNSRVLGAGADTRYLRQERVVVYRPLSGYLGPDYFTYIINDGLNVQSHMTINNALTITHEVTLHVRQCRRYEALKRSTKSYPIHKLCACQATENNVLGDNGMNCLRNVTSLCEKQDSESYSQYLNLCLTCVDEIATLISNNNNNNNNNNINMELSSSCKQNIARGVSFVLSRGLCDVSNPPIDCSAESVTMPGLEAVNYLSLQPPFLDGSYARLGNSFGGYGWYNTPVLR